MGVDKVYVKTPKYSEIMKPLSDAQSLKTMLDVGSCYPKLVKEFMVKLPIDFLSLIYGVNNDDTDRGVLNFSYKLFFGIHIVGASLPNVSVIEEYGLVGDEDMPSMRLIFGLVKSHILKALHNMELYLSMKPRLCKKPLSYPLS